MPAKGQRMSEEHKRKLSEANKGKHQWSQEARKKLSEQHLGKPLSEETRKKISENGKGKKRSMETRKKMSEAKLGEKHPIWKGNEVGYKALHQWVYRHKPCQTNCSMCGKVLPLELVNLSGEYRRDIEDFIWACRSCHRKFDQSQKNFKGIKPYKNKGGDGIGN